MTGPSYSKKKEENLKKSGLLLKESKKKDKYLDLARELKKKKLWNTKVTVIAIVIGALGSFTKRLVQGLEDLEIKGWVETMPLTALLRSSRILWKVLGTWEDFLSPRLMWKTII